MKKQIANISILQSSKIMTAMYFLLGLIYTLIGIPMFIFGHNQMKIIGIVYLFGPVFMSIFGFIFFVIFAAIYNALAAWLGGFEFEVKDAESEGMPPLP
jgi:hypothetical protein